jgi:protein-S-isoprenylcysteine O-methyltransferase Ste14
VRSFSRAATPLPTNQAVRVLVTTGIYGWSRNPIYLAFHLMYAGIGTAVCRAAAVRADVRVCDEGA